MSATKREPAHVVSRRASAARAERAARLQIAVKAIRLACDRRDIARLAAVVDAVLAERIAHAELGLAVENEDAEAVADARDGFCAAQAAIDAALAALVEPRP